MKKHLLATLSLGLVLLSACNSNTVSVTPDETLPTDILPTEEDIAENVMEQQESSAPAMEGTSSVAPTETDDEPQATGPRIIEVTVSNWTFSQTSIAIAKGENVILRLKGGEGRHGVAIPGMDINVEINPGETKDIPLNTDTAGTFAFRCSIPCGPGHKDMKGEIVIS